MGKEILILTGSPRHGGNSDLLAAAFQKGAEAAGHSVTQFATASKKFYPCLACDTCWYQGRPCSIKDDFNGLANLLEAADLIVFATPLYWFTFPPISRQSSINFTLMNRRRRLYRCMAKIALCCLSAARKTFLTLTRLWGYIKTLPITCNGRTKGYCWLPASTTKARSQKPLF